MTETIKYVYKCYIGKHLLYRTAMIVKFAKDNNGWPFFLQYSQPKDTVLEFLLKCEKLELL